MNKGKIIQVMGPVVDVQFTEDTIPEIKDALTCGDMFKKAYGKNLVIL